MVERIVWLLDEDDPEKARMGAAAIEEALSERGITLEAQSDSVYGMVAQGEAYEIGRIGLRALEVAVPTPRISLEFKVIDQSTLDAVRED